MEDQSLAEVEKVVSHHRAVLTVVTVVQVQVAIPVDMQAAQLQARDHPQTRDRLQVTDLPQAMDRLPAVDLRQETDPNRAGSDQTRHRHSRAQLAQAQIQPVPMVRLRALGREPEKRPRGRRKNGRQRKRRKSGRRILRRN
jgi:hypothetical protein